MTIDCVLSGMETSGEDKWVGERESVCECECVCVCVCVCVCEKGRHFPRSFRERGQTCTKFWMPEIRDGGWPC